MRTIRFLFILVCWGAAGLVAVACGDDDADAPTLVVITHGSFDMSSELIEQFEREHDVSVDIRKGGDAGRPAAREEGPVREAFLALARKVAELAVEV